MANARTAQNRRNQPHDSRRAEFFALPIGGFEERYLAHSPIRPFALSPFAGAPSAARLFG
jgi:hypothetical protein